MMNKKLHVLALSSVLFGLGLGADARAEPPAPVAGKVPIGATVTETEMVATGWRASKLDNADVVNDKGEKIGKVDDMIVAPDGKLSFAIIDVGGFLGVGSHRVAIPMTQLKLSSKGAKAVLAGGTKEALKALPEFHYEK
jgi:sporulation protein YlmC with PRC-barrel domain